MFKEYRYLCQIPNEKKKEIYWKRYTNFVKEQSLMFDIIASPDNIKTQEGLWGVKMGTFYENQKLTTPIGHCEAFVQQKWKLSRKRALKRKKQSRVESFYESFSYVKDTDVTDEQCDDMRDVELNVHLEPQTKKKYNYQETVDDPSDDLPYHYQHVCKGERSAKDEFWLVKKILQSKYHMSDYQSDTDIIEVANHLFGHGKYGKWKPYQANQPYDNNTLSAASNRR